KKPDYSAPPAGAEIVAFAGDPDLALAPADDPLGRAFLPLNPNEAIGSLDDSQIEAMIGAQAKTILGDLIEKDLAAPSLSSFQEIHKLVLFRAYLYTFLMNFLSFVDFYEPSKKAIFQEGVLYLDSRACYLCVPVENVDDHARLAAQSCLCLIYCACSRKAADGSIQTGTIAAALTLGNLVSLIEGRHGLFIDNDGLEWDTTILRVVHNPISLREAAWAPYIRISNMIAEQVNKFVASKEKAVREATDKAVSEVPAAKPEDKKQSFDFAKGAGIFAAVSVAVSVLSAAFAYIANSLASLGWWWPLAVVGLFICVSGPSMLLAYFKLRKRSLGPLLDASGWAVNKGAPINIMMGMALTKLGRLPKNALRNLNDPYSIPEQMKGGHTGWKIFFWLLFILVLAVAAFWLYCVFVAEPVWVTKLKLFLGL
ncbi:MAG: ABC transporter permease, partial [Desulfovibrio sp.]|nr:ABC transporter permease [Desulfovibrio sp.]